MQSESYFLKGNAIVIPPSIAWISWYKFEREFIVTKGIEQEQEIASANYWEFTKDSTKYFLYPTIPLLRDIYTCKVPLIGIFNCIASSYASYAYSDIILVEDKNPNFCSLILWRLLLMYFSYQYFMSLSL